MPITNHRISDPSIWKSRHHRDEAQWMCRFTTQQITELEDAAQRVLAKRQGPTAFGKEDFVLPTVEKFLAAQLRILDNGRGFIFLRGLDVSRYDSDTLKAIYWGICSHLGLGISQNVHGEVMSAVTDYGDHFDGDDPYRHNIRAHRTTVEIHPHTDSCDHVALLCVRPAKSGGQSAIASSLAIYNEIQETRPELLEPLRRGFFLDLVGKGTAQQQISFHRIPVFSYCNGKMSARFNKRQIELGAQKSEAGMGALSQSAIDYVRELSLREEFLLPMTFQSGDIQVLNNRVIFHARNAIVDDPQHKRLLYRVWLNARQPRPLAAEFANQLNSGERGGVTTRL